MEKRHLRTVVDWSINKRCRVGMSYDLKFNRAMERIASEAMRALRSKACCPRGWQLVAVDRCGGERQGVAGANGSTRCGAHEFVHSPGRPRIDCGRNTSQSVPRGPAFSADGNRIRTILAGGAAAVCRDITARGGSFGQRRTGNISAAHKTSWFNFENKAGDC